MIIRRYFDSPIFFALTLTDDCSRYFWETIPAAYHNFNTITSINNDFEDQALSEIDSDHSDNISDKGDEEAGPISNTEFQRTSHWYYFDENEFESDQCSICRLEFKVAERISAF